MRADQYVIVRHLRNLLRASVSDNRKGCRKGNRECTYPEPASNKSGSRPKKSEKGAQASEASSNEWEDEEGERADEEDEEEQQREVFDSKIHRPSTAIARGKEGNLTKKKSSHSLGKKKHARRQLDPATMPNVDKSKSPSTDVSSGPSRDTERFTSPSTNSSIGSPKAGVDFGHLKSDLQFYLNYHQQNLTHHHYFLKHDPQNFIHTRYLEIAVSYEPLLYAVVGFAAFHHTLKQPEGKIEDFLSYYNRSVLLFRRSLQHSQKHTEQMLLTVLQLASFEVSLHFQRSYSPGL